MPHRAADDALNPYIMRIAPFKLACGPQLARDVLVTADEHLATAAALEGFGVLPVPV
jgi:hypothetical protein